jgi:hypothetical protein
LGQIRRREKDGMEGEQNASEKVATTMSKEGKS